VCKSSTHLDRQKTADHIPRRCRILISYNMLRKILTYISFVLFISFLTLFALQIAGKSNILIYFISHYLNWLKQGQYFIVLFVSVIVVFGCTIIVTFGIFRNIISRKKSLTTIIFWFSFSMFLIIEIVGIYLLRRN